MFRQAAARDPTLHWDTIEEDIYVWAITQRHNTSTFEFQSRTSTFQDQLPILARLGRPSAESGKVTPPHATYTSEGKEICKRYNAGCCIRGEECIFTHICWHPGCLVEHPGKAWTHWLLNSIKNGVAPGYDSPRGPSKAHNLKSVLEHTQVIDEELKQECLTSRILGPFSSRPIKNLKCSGLRAVPKKGGEWCMILHLFAPQGKSINDNISKEDFLFITHPWTMPFTCCLH